MQFLMLLQGNATGAHESTPLDSAFVHLVTRVHLHVLLQIARRDRRVPAALHRALERLLARVRPDVDLQIALPDRGVVAAGDRAVVRLRLHHRRVARAAVVTTVAMALAIKTLRHARCHRGSARSAHFLAERKEVASHQDK